MKTERHGRYPITTSGSDTTYEADYTWQNSGTRYAFVGGGWSSGLYCGPFYAGLDGTATLANTGIGAALSCKPLAAA